MSTTSIDKHNSKSFRAIHMLVNQFYKLVKLVNQSCQWLDSEKNDTAICVAPWLRYYLIIFCWKDRWRLINTTQRARLWTLEPCNLPVGGTDAWSFTINLLLPLSNRYRKIIVFEPPCCRFHAHTHSHMHNLCAWLVVFLLLSLGTH